MQIDFTMKIIKQNDAWLWVWDPIRFLIAFCCWELWIQVALFILVSKYIVHLIFSIAEIIVSMCSTIVHTNN